LIIARLTVRHNSLQSWHLRIFPLSAHKSWY
jgi:hypothetical protein